MEAFNNGSQEGENDFCISVGSCIKAFRRACQVRRTWIWTEGTMQKISMMEQHLGYHPRVITMRYIIVMLIGIQVMNVIITLLTNLIRDTRCCLVIFSDKRSPFEIITWIDEVLPRLPAIRSQNGDVFCTIQPRIKANSAKSLTSLPLPLLDSEHRTCQA